MGEPPPEGAAAPAEVCGGGEAAEETRAPAGDIAEPERLLCPITHIMYRDPCFVPESGNTYERLAVERYWASTPKPRDPLTNIELHSRVLHPNWGVRRDVQRFLEENPGLTPQGWPDREVPLPAESAGRGAGAGGRLFARAPFAALSRFRAVHLVAVALALLAALYQCSWLPTRTGGAASVARRRAADGSLEALHPPKGSLLEAWTGETQLLVYAPPKGFDTDLAGQLFFACFWTGFTALWTMGAVQNGAPVMFAMFSLPFWGVGLSLLASLAKAPFQSELLDLSMTDYALSKDWFGFTLSNSTGTIADLSEPPLSSCDGDRCEIVLRSGLQELVFGGALHSLEARWVREALGRHLLRTPGGSRFDVQPSDRTVDRAQAPHRQRSSPGFQFGVAIR